MAKKEITKEGRKPHFQAGAMPGTTLKREYHEKEYTVNVKPDGFHYNGNVFTGLSKIASSITKQSTNGPLWFGLPKAVKRAEERLEKAAKPAKKAGRKHGKARAKKPAAVAQEAVAA